MPKVTGFALRSIQNTVGRLQAPDFRCWTSSRNRAGKTFKMCEAVSLWDVIGTLPKGAGNGTAPKTKKPSSTRKYICPCCHQSVRATKAVNILCGDCMEKMEPTE
ncbi:MAG: hypothetical protein ACLUOA_05185 [Gemmiger formicilis]|uniref:hypothetical protein n=1 Tax=Gemmiger formicilis TaxID=745368 RepID=UPI0039933D16